MSARRDSKIIAGMERGLTRFWIWLSANSGICGGLLRLSARVRCTLPGILDKHRAEPRVFRSFFLRQRLMRAWDQSFLICLLHTWKRWILDTSTLFFGRILFLVGILGTCGGVFRGCDLYSVDILLPLVLFFCSLSLLRTEESLGMALINSWSGVWLLSILPASSECRAGFSKEGKARIGGSLALSSVIGGISFFASPWPWLLLPVGGLLLCLFFTVPEFFALLLCAVLPFLNLVPHPTVTLLCFAVLLILFWGCKILRCHRMLTLTWLDLPVLLLLVSYLLEGLFGGGREAWMAGMGRGILLFLYFPFRSFLRQKIWRTSIAVSLLISSFICAFLGTFQYIFGFAPLEWVDISRFSDIGGRVTSCFFNPNLFAMFLLLTTPLSLGIVLSEAWSRRTRGFSALCFLIQSAALLLTWSRGAWLGWILAVFFTFLFISSRTQALLITLTPLLPAVAVWSPGNIQNRFSSIGSLSESSIRFRLYTWKGVLQMLKAHPFGVGLGESNFRSSYLPFAVSGTERVVHTHQWFLQLWCELGVIGLIVLFGFLAMLGLVFWDSRRNTPTKEHTYCVGALCGIFGLATMGWFDSVWYHNGIFTLFWILAALAVSTAGRGSEEK